MRQIGAYRHALGKPSSAYPNPPFSADAVDLGTVAVLLRQPGEPVTRPSVATPSTRILQDHPCADDSAGPRHIGPALLDLRGRAEPYNR